MYLLEWVVGEGAIPKGGELSPIVPVHLTAVVHPAPFGKLTTTRENSMRTKNSVHPGRIVRYDCLESLGLTVTAGAKVLGVSRQTLNNVVNERTGISAEMAIRLSKA